MFRSRRVIVVVAVAVTLAVGLAVATLVAAGSGDDDEGGGDGARTVQPGAPGEESRELDEDEAADVSSPEHTEADTEFMQRMIVHHLQALDMAALVEERTQRGDLPQLAERITISQEDEIERVTEWLTDRDEEVPDESDHLGHEQMPGMATDDQIERLRAARGAEFDRLFLDLMIAHHQGALLMVQELYTAGGGLEPAIDDFARDVDADQTIEIQRMQDLRETLP